MKHTPTILAMLLLAALPATAGTTMAGSGKCTSCCTPAPEQPDFSYNFVEAGWTHLNFDDFGKTDGYYAHVSFSPVQSLFVFGEWGQDFGNPDRNLLDLGVGVYVPLVKRVHWVTQVGAGWVDTRAGDASDSSWAFNASTGLRIRVCSYAELQVAYDLSVDSDDAHHGASAALLCDLNKNVQLVLSGHFSEEANGFGVGLRYNF